MRYDYIVWDFNGTILDDVGIGIESINVVLSRRGLPQTDITAYRELFCFPVEDYYRKLGIDIDGEGYDKPAKEWVKEYRSREKNAKVRDGVISVVERLSSLGYPQAIISATKESMLIEQLEALGIKDKFDTVLGCRDIYAKSKSDVAASFAKEHKGKILMIGDTLHDKESADAGGFDTVFISRGHQSRRILEGAGRPIFDTFEEIYGYIIGE